MTSIIGIKTQQGQKFLENGARIPVTYVNVAGNTVVALRTAEKNNYFAIQLGILSKKRSNKASLGHAKGAGLESAPNFLREVPVSEEERENLPSVGDKLNPQEILKPGDIINVTGTSKGKGFAGGVKRHNFSGGPKTHGQSDRHRAPGSIGQGTTPGRVYKGKRMAGRMGNEQVTVRNLTVVDVTADQVLIEGLVPGIVGGLIMLKKVGESKKFVPLYKEISEADQSDQASESSSEEAQLQEASPVSEEASQAPAEEAEGVSEGSQTQDTAPADQEDKESSEDKPKEEVQEEVGTEEIKEEVAKDASK